MASIVDLIAIGKEAGIFDFYLPFILMFAVLYGILTKINIFGDPKENKFGKTANLIIALFGSLAIMVYTPAGVTLIDFLSKLFGETLVIVLSLMAFVIILTMLKPFGIEMGGIAGLFNKRMVYILLLGAFILAVGVFISSGGTAFFPGLKIPGITSPTFSISGISSETLAIIIVVLLTGIIIWFMTRGGEEAGARGGGQRPPGV